ncbi:MAG: hypothetical protein HY211_04575 [Candidatus Omnitrophica bacterium]|nr:hypothetical protein [Candidatus Omnitrophota bacterium]
MIGWLLLAGLAGFCAGWLIAGRFRRRRKEASFQALDEALQELAELRRENKLLKEKLHEE